MKIKHTLTRLLILIFVLLSGCTTTILDKHNEMMANYPGRTHYATAAPVSAFRGATRESVYRSACFYYGNYPAYHRDTSKSYYKYYTGHGGSSQQEIEDYVITNCERSSNDICVVLLYNKYERCDATFDVAFEKIQATWVAQRENQDKKIREEEARKADQLQNTCLSFGIKANTSQMSTCMMELYKTNAQIEAIRRASETQAQATNAAAEEAAKLLQFQQGMELLKQSNQMLNPTQQNRMTTNCRYNTVMKTISCN